MISGAQTDLQGGIFFMVDGYDRRDMSSYVNTMFGFFWTSSIGFASLYGSLPMYFRYVTFCKEETVSTFRIFSWISLVVVTAVWNCTWALHSAFDNLQRHDELAELLDHDFWSLPDGELPFFSGVSLTNLGGLMFALSCTISFSVSTSLGIYLVMKIRAKLEEVSKSALSDKTKRLQTQMNRMIIFQLFIATVLGQLPVFLVAGQMIFQTHFPPSLTIVVGCMDPLLPVVNPLADIFFVDAYRRQLFALPRQIWSKHSKAINHIPKSTFFFTIFTKWERTDTVGPDNGTFS
ncbi:unnamed protein product [Bursaphelenchus okinawaensis]|uniref:G_PROTEIN_RECEP_F1_2 domain-containing protein n=1 Tax=Bursaphelenchus okinawaensis TaxID=465554 RepID=A0A811LU01_9BILA|nr:unnamed protein product [Bursaphelenchus okinawaensis]CAG9127815.1 unnamed protein product [Bursaphelenchus okinawaensis]